MTSPLRRKRDLLLVASLSPATLPLAGTVLTASRLIDGPGVIFQQKRVGQEGELFTINKVRTMVKPETPTRLGKILRVLGLDEIPQLINIAKDEMAVFGPRVLVPEDLETMSQTLPRNLYDQWENVYFRSKPGCISSFAHNSRSTTADMESKCYERAELDIMDFENASPLRDIQMTLQIGRTAARIAGQNI